MRGQAARWRIPHFAYNGANHLAIFVAQNCLILGADCARIRLIISSSGPVLTHGPLPEAGAANKVAHGHPDAPRRTRCDSTASSVYTIRLCAE